MNLSIIGAGRARNGIGEYIGKYFHQLGGKVTSVLGTTEKTSRQASFALRKYGIEARPYADFDEMVRRERLNAVVIASPSFTHYEYLLKSIESGLHIFCEKPFIWDDHPDILKRVDEIFKKASERKLIIAMNSQWPFSVEAYEELCGKLRIKESNAFFIRMSPFSQGKAMIPESLPHPLSLLYCLLGTGEIEDLNFESEGEGDMNIQFTYLFGTKACDVAVRLVHQKTPPREFSFGFNDKIAVRSLDLQNYEIYFNYQDKKLRIQDPLELSVKNFMEAVEKKTEPFIGTRHILHNMSLLKEIDDGFGEFEKKNLWKS
jgi:predicted dehydrogenase